MDLGNEHSNIVSCWIVMCVIIKFQVQMKKDGGGSTGQSWMETSSLWPMLHGPPGAKMLKPRLHKRNMLSPWHA